MSMSREKPPLTDEERAEKRRLDQLFRESKPEWKRKHGVRLTQSLLGQLVGELVNGEPMTQGAIWQYLKEEHPTKLSARVVQAIAMVCGFEPKEVSPRFQPEHWVGFEPTVIESEGNLLRVHYKVSEGQHPPPAPEDFLGTMEQYGTYQFVKLAKAAIPLLPLEDRLELARLALANPAESNEPVDKE